MTVCWREQGCSAGLLVLAAVARGCTCRVGNALSWWHISLVGTDCRHRTVPVPVRVVLLVAHLCKTPLAFQSADISAWQKAEDRRGIADSLQRRKEGAATAVWFRYGCVRRLHVATEGCHRAAVPSRPPPPPPGSHTGPGPIRRRRALRACGRNGEGAAAQIVPAAQNAPDAAPLSPCA